MELRYSIVFILLFTGCAGLKSMYQIDPLDQRPRLRWNYMEKEYSYAGAEEKLRYNYMENRYEFSK